MKGCNCPLCGRFMSIGGTWTLDRGHKPLGFIYTSVRMTAWVCWSCRNVELAAKKVAGERYGP